jgi:hypothetical protein
MKIDFSLQDLKHKYFGKGVSDINRKLNKKFINYKILTVEKGGDNKIS